MLGVLSACGPLSIDFYLPGLPAIARDLHSDAGAAQRTVAVFFFGMALGGLFYGPISDRFGRRLPLFAGLALYVAASAGCALATSMEFLTIMRFLQALGACAGVIIARAVVRDRFSPRETVQIFSTLMLIFGVSPILAPLFGGWVLLVADWRTIFWILTAFGAMILAMVYFWVPESRSSETETLARSENPLISYRTLMTNSNVMGFVLIGAFAGASMPTYVSSSPSVMIGGYHVSPEMFGWFFGINGAGLIGGSQINGFIGRYYPPDLVLKVANRISFGLAIIMLINAVTGFGGMWGVLAPLFLLITSMGFNQPNSLAGAMAEDPHRAGAAASLVVSGQLAVGTMCSFAASAFLDGSPRPMALVITLSTGIAVALFAIMRPQSAHFGRR